MKERNQNSLLVKFGGHFAQRIRSKVNSDVPFFVLKHLKMQVKMYQQTEGGASVSKGVCTFVSVPNTVSAASRSVWPVGKTVW